MTNDIYERYRMAENLLKLHEFSKGKEHLEFHKMCITGDLQFFDYGRGLLVVRISASRWPHGKNPDGYGIRLGMITVDDGDMGGWIENIPTFEEAAEKARAIAEVFSDITVLPTREKINEQLFPLGICLDYE